MEFDILKEQSQPSDATAELGCQTECGAGDLPVVSGSQRRHGNNCPTIAASLAFNANENLAFPAINIYRILKSEVSRFYR